MRFYPQILLLVAAAVTFSAHAFEPFVVKDIRIEGIQRTEAGTIFSYMPVKVGDKGMIGGAPCCIARALLSARCPSWD